MIDKEGYEWLYEVLEEWEAEEIEYMPPEDWINDDGMIEWSYVEEYIEQNKEDIDVDYAVDWFENNADLIDMD